MFRIKSCAGLQTTNAAFGPGGTLCITESATGAILQAELDVPGKRIFSHMEARGGQ